MAQVPQSRHDSEARYKTLFETLIEGFCTIELIFDANGKLQAQLERLGLLQQITRAIGERQDLKSIFGVAIRTLEDRLPIDFGCVCLYESSEKCLTVAGVGLRSQELAMQLGLTERVPAARTSRSLSAKSGCCAVLTT